MNAQFIINVILGIATIYFASAWATERKSRKFFSRMYTKSVIKYSKLLDRKFSTSGEG
nr:hypothetical protein [uncultured Draconibacterium sp.]